MFTILLLTTGSGTITVGYVFRIGVDDATFYRACSRTRGFGAGLGQQLFRVHHRVEKTRLIREYITDKPAAYFMALEADDATNLASFSRVFSQFQASTGTGLGGHGRVMARLRICLLTWRIRLLRRRLCWSSMNFRTWWRVVRRFLRCCKSFAIRSGP